MQRAELAQYSDQATEYAGQVSIPGGGKKLFSLPKRPDRLWRLTSLPFSGYRGALLGVNCPRRDADRSPPSRAQVKSYTSTPPVCRYRVDREKFTFFWRLRKFAKSDYQLRHVCPSVCLYLSPWNKYAPTGRIFMKIDICPFFENLSRKFKFH